MEHQPSTDYIDQTIQTLESSLNIDIQMIDAFIVNKLMQAFRVGDPSQSIDILKLFLKQESYEKTLEYFNYTLYEYMPGSLLIKILGTTLLLDTTINFSLPSIIMLFT